MINTQELSFSFNAAYYLSGNPDADELWFVLHGYGQLARYFVRKFGFLEDKALVIAPEGLSHFYLQGTSGRVGASWMSSEKRLMAIQNYVSYLNAVYHQVTSVRPNPPASVNMLGFSQGVSTLIRWLVSSEISFNKLFICAGGFPEDIDKIKARNIFKNKPCWYLYGDQDEYIQKDNLQKLQKVYPEYGVDVEFVQFTGKHEVHLPTLREVVQKSR